MISDSDNNVQIWAVPKERIDAFLSKVGYSENGKTYFVSGGIQVTVKSLPRRIVGSVSLPQTEVAFSGSGNSLKDFKVKFLHEFLSGGG